VVTADLSADAYAVLGTGYDAWCNSVTEDIDFYVRLAIECGGPVLEVGVGSGRIAVPTALAGIAVVGVDRSGPMLDLAAAKSRAQGVSLELVRADMRELPELGTFPLVTVPFRALLHLRDDAERLGVFRSLRARLEPGGLLAFDVFHPDRRDIEETDGRWLEREPGIVERADWHPADASLTLCVRADGREAGMQLWWLDPDDWGRLLAEAGFDRVQRFGGFHGEPLTEDGADSVWLAGRSGSGGG
jgi:SAM-dependent methyltransferase